MIVLPQELIDRFARIRFLAEQALVAEAKAQEYTFRLADLGWISDKRPTLPNLSELYDSLRAQEELSRSSWEKIAGLGGIVKDQEMGFVDFPAPSAEKPLVFCWQFGESLPYHWHFEDEDCESRRPLTE